jgi:hypothetical protein
VINRHQTPINQSLTINFGISPSTPDFIMSVLSVVSPDLTASKTDFLVLVPNNTNGLACLSLKIIII